MSLLEILLIIAGLGMVAGGFVYRRWKAHRERVERDRQMAEELPFMAHMTEEEYQTAQDRFEFIHHAGRLSYLFQHVATCREDHETCEDCQELANYYKERSPYVVPSDPEE